MVYGISSLYLGYNGAGNWNRTNLMRLMRAVRHLADLPA